jgi:hypothetical protein
MLHGSPANEEDARVGTVRRSADIRRRIQKALAEAADDVLHAMLRLTIGLLPAVIILIPLLYSISRGSRSADRVDPVSEQHQRHTTEISTVSADIQRLRAEVNALSRSPDRTAVGPQLARLDTIAADLQRRQQRIEGAIMADPAKALQLPLLHRDIEMLRAAQLQQVEGLRKEVDRLYDVTKWVIGGLSAAVLMMVLQFGSSVFRQRSGESERKS